MKKIYYDMGPDRIEVGMVGEMERGKPVPIDDEIAAKLLAKRSGMFKEAEVGRKKEEKKSSS